MNSFQPELANLSSSCNTAIRFGVSLSQGFMSLKSRDVPLGFYWMRELLGFASVTQNWRSSGSNPQHNSKFGHKIKNAGKIRPPVCSCLLISNVYYYFKSLQLPKRPIKCHLSNEIAGGLRAVMFTHKVMLQGNRKLILKRNDEVFIFLTDNVIPD